MNIRTRITLIFFIIVIVIQAVISFSVYFFSANHRAEDFSRRLKNRAINTAKILTQVKELNVELLKRMEQNNPASLPNQFIIIYDFKNNERYSSDGKPVISVNDSLLNKIKRKEELTYWEGKFEVIGFLFIDGNDYFTVIAAATDVYGLDALKNLRNVLLITFCISLFFVSILGWIYAGRILSPISDIVNQVSKITDVNLTQRLDEGNKIDELSKLSQTFNLMLERLQAAFVSQKNFIANASHEIKTPITVMAGEIEVALLQKRDHEYYIKVLRSVLMGLKGLNNLSSQLLWLAQTNNYQPEKYFTSFRIDDILWESKAELLKAFPDYSIQINFDLKLRQDSLIIEGDEQLIKVAILNLMDNGCKYSLSKSVIIHLESNETHFITIRFVNDGQGIPHHQLDRIFEPFFRSKGTRKIKGSGIGLSLVKGVITLHNGFISVNSIANETTQFVIKLPSKGNTDL